MIDVSAKIPVVSASAALGGKTPQLSEVRGKDATVEIKSHQDLMAGNDVSLSKLEETLNKYVPQDLPNTRLQIVHDDGTGQFVYKAVDQDSGEVVRQYPSEEILKFISYYREQEGLLVDGTA